MAWITPKTNWTNEDRFNTKDYNRIKGNLEFLKSAYDKYYKNIEQLPMQEQIIGNNARVSTFNLLPHNLYLLNRDTIKYTDILDMQFRGNEIATNNEQWNTIEKHCLRMYQTMFDGYLDLIPHLSIRLGNRKPFGRRV